jgi:hypothetical protein
MIKRLSGRGNKAPYDSVSVRCPEPIHPQVLRLTSMYRGWAISGPKVIPPPRFVYGDEVYSLYYSFNDEIYLDTDFGQLGDCDYRVCYVRGVVIGSVYKPTNWLKIKGWVYVVLLTERNGSPSFCSGSQSEIPEEDLRLWSEFERDPRYEPHRLSN